MTPWTRESLAWLAGLFEGEGCFTTRTSDGKQYGTLRITMTDEDVVRRAQAVTSLGSVCGPYMGKQAVREGHTRKAAWMWVVSSERDVQALIAAMWPWLGTRRRERAAELIELWKTREGARGPRARPGYGIRNNNR